MRRILEISNICKSFPGVKALDDVSFDLFENFEERGRFFRTAVKNL